MKERLLSVAVERETDIVLVRDRTRRVAALVGFGTQDQTRVTTAVSEIVRNAWEYGQGGRIEYWLIGAKAPELIEIVVTDQGPGIHEIGQILAGSYVSKTGMGVGILGARRLMDEFDVSTDGAGTKITLRKHLPSRGEKFSSQRLRDIGAALSKQPLQRDPMEEVRQQNQEMLVQLEELQKRQEQLAQLNQELEDTNRGVVALYAELEERADHLRHADELKSRFLSNMSHEFRTPLNSILSLSRLLLMRTDGELSAEQEKQIGYVRTAAENLTELVNDLLDLAKVEAGKTVVAPTEFYVPNLFGALRGMLRPLLVADSVKLVFDDLGNDEPLFTDEGKVSQILRNYISNALKFTQSGEIRVWAAPGEESDTITFFVKDTGIGIAPEHQDVIWQEFGQAPQTAAPKIKGTGLGLPISKRFGELLGGRVGVESDIGQGALFWLTIPRVYRLAKDEELEAVLALDASRAPILSVEDNSADAFALGRAFSNTRYQLIPVKSVAQGRRALERVTPAAIILDILLVGEESWRFLIELKQNERTQNIPVIVLSSTAEERKARSLGADEYLGKPIDPASVVGTIDKLTGRHSVTKVLLVDDEEVFRYLVRQLLPRGAFDIKEAKNCADGLARLEADDPDIILLDLNMPDGSGLEFLDRMRVRESRARIPTIILTSLRLDTQQRLRLAEADHVLSKAELTTDLLVDKIHEAIINAAIH